MAQSKRVAALSVCLLLASAAIKKAETICCTSGFPSLQQLLTTTKNTGYLQAPFLQGVFPTMHFTCNGTLTQLIYRTVPQGSQAGSLEEFRLWRRSSEHTSNVFQTISRRSNEVLFRNLDPDNSLYSISNLSISIQAEDHLGISTRFVRSSLEILDVRNQNASDFYYSSGTLLSANFSNVEGSPFMPLITAVISPSSTTVIYSKPSSSVFTSSIISTSYTPEPSPLNPTSTAKPSTSVNVKVMLAATGAGAASVILCVIVTIPAVWFLVKRKSRNSHSCSTTEGANSISKSQKSPSDGDDESMESNPAYSNPTDFQRYNLQEKVEDPIYNRLQSAIEMSCESHPTMESESSESSSVFYSKLAFNELGDEESGDNDSVYYTQPFSVSHHSLEDGGGSDSPPPLSKSRDSADGITTVINISYQRTESRTPLVTDS